MHVDWSFSDVKIAVQDRLFRELWLSVIMQYRQFVMNNVYDWLGGVLQGEGTF